jgi:hypothetical protein
MSSGDCLVSSGDQGHWESFTITANSDVEIGYCCTDPDGLVKPEVRNTVLISHCDFCDEIESDPTAVGEGCFDGQPSDMYTMLPAGTYHYSVYSGKYCLNSDPAQACYLDAHCTEFGGECFRGVGPYDLKITATALPHVACCMAATCVDGLDVLECEAAAAMPAELAFRASTV